MISDKAQGALQRKLAAQRKQFDKLKADAEIVLKDTPPSQRREDLERIIAELERRFAEIESREGLPPLCPTADAPAKAYVHELILRIEECGTRNFPKAGTQSLYGTATLNFSINLQGELEELEIHKSSGVGEIDDHSLRIIRASAPFGAVPRQLHRDRFTRFLFSSRFTFVRNRNPGKPPKPKVRCTFE